MTIAARRPKNRIPGPTGFPILGNTFDFLRDPLDFGLRCAREFGDVFRIAFPGFSTVLVSHPDDIRTVLLHPARFRKSKYSRGLGAVLGTGLLVNDEPSWQRRRRAVHASLHGQRLPHHAEDIALATQKFIRRWPLGKPRDLHADMMELTLEIISRSLFGVDLKIEEARDIDAILETLMKYYLSVARFVVPEGVPTPGYLRQREAKRRLDETLYGIIRRRRASREPRHDVLSTLMAFSDKTGAGMTDEELRDELVTLFTAGHETTALALSYTFYLLSRHPEAEARLRAEVDRVLGRRAPRFEDAAALPYTEAVVKEAMRIYPPAWGISREAVEDCELGGYRVRRGTQISIWQWIVHRDPRFFDDPETFRPERWEHAKKLHPFAYLPFGHGPRTCIGANFAVLELVLIVAAIVQKIEVRVFDEGPIAVTPFVTLRLKKPIRAMLRSRVSRKSRPSRPSRPSRG